jgi:hypothetical protein
VVGVLMSVGDDGTITIVDRRGRPSTIPIADVEAAKAFPPPAR